MSMLNVAKQIATTGSRTEKFTDVGVNDMSSGQILLLLIRNRDFELNLFLKKSRKKTYIYLILKKIK